MKKLAVILMMLSLGACSTRSVRVMDASWVSMKHSTAPADLKAIKNVGQVEERYCMKSWRGSYGLMDEVVKQAELNHGVDYIRNASFTKEVGQPCATVVGQGYRLVR